jgi:hypothetical protein
MAATPDNPQLAQPPQMAAPRPIRTVRLVSIGSACTAVGVAVLSKDWCFSTVSCTLGAALIISLLDAFVLRRVTREQPWGRKAQVAMLIVVCGSFFACFGGTTNRLFRRVFGISPPPGVRELVIDSATIGLSGDRTILMRFKADQATINGLAQARGFAVDKDMNLFYETDKDWSRLWSHAFSSFPDSGGRAWRDVTPMADPIFFIHNHSEGIAPVTVKMLWDRASGRAYVLCLY